MVKKLKKMLAASIALANYTQSKTPLSQRFALHPRTMHPILRPISKYFDKKSKEWEVLHTCIWQMSPVLDKCKIIPMKNGFCEYVNGLPSGEFHFIIDLPLLRGEAYTRGADKDVNRAIEVLYAVFLHFSTFMTQKQRKAIVAAFVVDRASFLRKNKIKMPQDSGSAFRLFTGKKFMYQSPNSWFATKMAMHCANKIRGIGSRKDLHPALRVIFDNYLNLGKPSKAKETKHYPACISNSMHLRKKR